MKALLRIGTRGSPLALAQARLTRERLAAAWPDLQDDKACEIVPITTSGDRIQDRSLIEAGGKGLFTKEIDDALLSGVIDIAVHSMKDVPTSLPDGIEMGAILPRETPLDAWFSNHDGADGTPGGIDDLPLGAVVGTASLRRQAQLLARRPDLTIKTLRGNVGTRLDKLAAGDVDATLLAVAGLKRLGEAERIKVELSPDIMLPAPAQGAIGIAMRTDDYPVMERIAALNCIESAQRLAAERAALASLDGSCRTPIAALAIITEGTMLLDALIALPNGRKLARTQRQGPARDAVAMGADAGDELRQMLPEALDSLKPTSPNILRDF